MATEAARLKRKKSLVRKRKTDLTLAGLLMEGLGPLALYELEPASFVCDFVVFQSRQFYLRNDCAW